MKMPMLRGGVACITKLVGSSLSGRGKKKKKKNCFVLFLPHPAPRVPGSVVDKSRERLCGLGAAAWLPRREGSTGPRAQSAGTMALVGWERVGSYWAVGCCVLLFVDGHSVRRVV